MQGDQFHILWVYDFQETLKSSQQHILLCVQQKSPTYFNLSATKLNEGHPVRSTLIKEQILSVIFSHIILMTLTYLKTITLMRSININDELKQLCYE